MNTSGQRICQKCKIRTTKSKHFNSKYCEPCRIYLFKKPKGSLTKSQILEAKRLAGTMPREWIALALNVSLSNLKRSCDGVEFNYYNKYKANPELTKQVLKYYEKHGKTKTQNKFPEVSVRSIVERYKHQPRQLRWTGREIIELVKMHGFISKAAQAKYFNRPRANAGSITSAWQKTLKIKSANVKTSFHVSTSYKIKQFLKKSCPTIQVANKNVQRAYLWHDINKHLKKDSPDLLKQCAEAIADFQEWLYGSKNPRAEIVKMIIEREK